MHLLMSGADEPLILGLARLAPGTTKPVPSRLTRLRHSKTTYRLILSGESSSILGHVSMMVSTSSRSRRLVFGVMFTRSSIRCR